MAEGIFIDLVQKAGLLEAIAIDSAGTSDHHRGERADHRMRATAMQHGIDLVTTSRPLKPRDLQTFDYILTMDRSVHRAVSQMQQPDSADSKGIILMREFDPQPDDVDVPDPYYGGADGFEEVYRILFRSCEALLAKIRADRGI